MKSKATLLQYLSLIVKLNPNIIVLKNELGEMRTRTRSCIIRFHKVDILCNMRKHEPNLDINYEEL